MKLLIELPDYCAEEGFVFKWEENSWIKVVITEDLEVHLIANKDGLLSLAYQFLNLAQEAFPPGCDFYLTAADALEKGSCEFWVQKTVDSPREGA